MKISACMIVKNEEKVIARCIESYRASVDEIIVVDTGSDDQTVAIAKGLGAKVFHFNWIDDFAAAKNYAISKAKGDWIVFLDADEYFANSTGKGLKAFLTKLDKVYNAVACRMINLDETTGKVINEIVHVRIFRNDRQLRYINPIHEVLHYDLKGAKLQAHLADRKNLLIHHTGYSTNISQEKAQRNLALLLRQLDNEATAKPEYYYYIADTYHSLDEWSKVIAYIRLFLASGAKLINLNVRVHNILIDAMMNLHYPAEEVMGEINAAIDRFPEHPLFYFYKAKLLYDDKCYDAAFLNLRQSLMLHETYEGIEVNSLAVNIATLYNIMGVISEFRNDIGAAIGYYLDALKQDKHDTTAFDRLIKLIRMQPLEDIVTFLNSLYDIENEADLDFLAAGLVNQPAAQVLAYYTNLREKKYSKQDIIVLQMLVANKYYDKAFPALLNYYRHDQDERLAALVAATALLSGNEIYIEQCSLLVPPSYVNIINAYYGRNHNVSDESIPAYLHLTHLLILWGDSAGLDRMISLVDVFPSGIRAAAKAGSIFISERDYRNGLRLYRSALDRARFTSGQMSSSLYFNLGYCLYRINDYNAAVEGFILAYKSGYRTNDLFEFLRWSIHNETDMVKVKSALEEDWRYVQLPQSAGAATYRKA